MSQDLSRARRNFEEAILAVVKQEHWCLPPNLQREAAHLLLLDIDDKLRRYAAIIAARIKP